MIYCTGDSVKTEIPPPLAPQPPYYLPHFSRWEAAT